MKTKEWQWAEGYAGFNKADPNKVGAELEKIEQREGEIIPAEVVTHASNPRSAMHCLFTWDNRKAAEKYREDQARDLIRHLRSVTITIEKGTDKQRQVISRVFVMPRQSTKAGYISIANITEPDIIESLIERARRDLEAWTDRYADISDQLEALFKEVMAARKKDKAA